MLPVGGGTNLATAVPVPGRPRGARALAAPDRGRPSLVEPTARAGCRRVAGASRMPIIDDLFAANAAYADRFALGDLPMPPRRKLVVIACMDARFDPLTALGLAEGDANVLRNSGGRTTEDVIRSLVVSQQRLGTEAVLVVHHTDCGTLTFGNDAIRAQVRERLGADADGIDFLPFADVDQSVRDDVAAIRDSPLVPASVTVAGAVYDDRTGRLRRVE